LDVVPEVGGQNKSPKPKEFMLTSLAGCAGLDVISILQKMRITIDNFNIDIEAELVNKSII
jgi:putative redox protein